MNLVGTRHLFLNPLAIFTSLLFDAQKAVQNSPICYHTAMQIRTYVSN